MAGYYFRLPPFIQWTPPQQAAANEPRQIALTGGPGTGKSVVSIWRHIRNYLSNPVKRSMLVTYTTTLKAYLAACCRNINDDGRPNVGSESSSNVGTSIRNSELIHNTAFAELIIDEAQDLSNDYYSGIPSPLSYGADDSQILYHDHCSTEAQLHNLFPSNVLCPLDRNFRNTQRIMRFARQAFPYANISFNVINGLADNVGEKPVLLISNTFDKTRDAIERIVNSFRADDHNIAILVPWREHVKAFQKNALNFKNIDHSIYYEDQNDFPHGCEIIKNVHITTFKSSKGLEFDTVIIPNFDFIMQLPYYVSAEENMNSEQLERMEETIHRLDELQKDHDIIVSKLPLSDGLFKVRYRKLMCSWEDMYVAVTRARSNLYLISPKDLPHLNSVIEKEIL